MNELYAADQAEALKRLAFIADTYRPAYLRMEMQKDGSYLIIWGEQE